MKELYKFLGYFAVGFFVCFWLMRSSCEGIGGTGITTVPEINGTFPAAKPAHVSIDDKLATSNATAHQSVKKGKFRAAKPKPQVLRASDSKLIDSLQTENSRLREQYAAASDSLKSKLYDDSISLKAFSHSWENDDLALQISGFVRGEVQSIEPIWKIKERKAPSVQKRFAMLAGADMGITVPDGTFKARGMLFFQNSHGDLIFGGYDTGQMVSVGFAKQIFSVKK